MVDIILSGTYNFGHAFKVEYIEHYALCGLPCYFVHRARTKDDKAKTQQGYCEIPLPEPSVVLKGGYGDTEDTDDYFFADVVFANTFAEAKAFLGDDIRTYLRGKDWSNFCQQRAIFDADRHVAYLNEYDKVRVGAYQPQMEF